MKSVSASSAIPFRRLRGVKGQGVTSAAAWRLCHVAAASAMRSPQQVRAAQTAVPLRLANAVDAAHRRPVGHAPPTCGALPP